MVKYWYIVVVGIQPGIYEEWTQVGPRVSEIPGAIHKKFKTLREARDAFTRARREGLVREVHVDPVPEAHPEARYVPSQSTPSRSASSHRQASSHPNAFSIVSPHSSRQSHPERSTRHSTSRIAQDSQVQSGERSGDPTARRMRTPATKAFESPGQSHRYYEQGALQEKLWNAEAGPRNPSAVDIGAVFRGEKSVDTHTEPLKPGGRREPPKAEVFQALHRRPQRDGERQITPHSPTQERGPQVVDAPPPARDRPVLGGFERSAGTTFPSPGSGEVNMHKRQSYNTASPKPSPIPFRSEDKGKQRAKRLSTVDSPLSLYGMGREGTSKAWTATHPGRASTTPGPSRPPSALSVASTDSAKSFGSTISFFMDVTAETGAQSEANAASSASEALHFDGPASPRSFHVLELHPGQRQGIGLEAIGGHSSTARPVPIVDVGLSNQSAPARERHTERRYPQPTAPTTSRTPARLRTQGVRHGIVDRAPLRPHHPSSGSPRSGASGSPLTSPALSFLMQDTEPLSPRHIPLPQSPATVSSPGSSALPRRPKVSEQGAEDEAMVATNVPGPSRGQEPDASDILRGGHSVASPRRVQLPPSPTSLPGGSARIPAQPRHRRIPGTPLYPSLMSLVGEDRAMLSPSGLGLVLGLATPSLSPTQVPSVLHSPSADPRSPMSRQMRIPGDFVAASPFGRPTPPEDNIRLAL